MFASKLLCLALALTSVAWAREASNRVHIRISHGAANFTVKNINQSPMKIQHHAKEASSETSGLYVYNDCPFDVQYQADTTDGFSGPARYLRAGDSELIEVTNFRTNYITACRNEVCGATFGPYTRAELQLDSKGVDRYGISLAHGANIPIGVMPLGGDYSHYANYGDADPYYCTSTGMDCYWEFDAHEDIRYNAVFGGSGRPCSSQNDCSGSEVCGYKHTDGGLNLYCGERYGYYNGDRICSVDPSNELFHCAEPAGDKTGLTMTDMYTCLDPAYLDGYDSASEYRDGEVCGCTNWNDRNVAVQYTDKNKCKASNNAWTDKVAPILDIFKLACSSTFTYAKDYPTSMFSCRRPLAYMLKFCPDGKIIW